MPEPGTIRQSCPLTPLKVFRETFTPGPNPYVMGGFTVVMKDPRVTEIAKVNCRGAIAGPSSPAVTFSAHVEPIVGTPRVAVKLYVAGAGLNFVEPVGQNCAGAVLDITVYGY